MRTVGLQALQSNRDTELNDLSAALASLCRGHAVTLQWIPSHCNVPGNEAADSLAKEGTTKEQVDRSTRYPEVQTILKAKQHSKWRHKHPRYKADPYYLLTRREQVTVFRLRTGHNRLNYHLYSKLRIDHTEQCPCGTPPRWPSGKASASRAEDPGFESPLRRDFFGVESYQ